MPSDHLIVQNTPQRTWRKNVIIAFWRKYVIIASRVRCLCFFFQKQFMWYSKSEFVQQLYCLCFLCFTTNLSKSMSHWIRSSKTCVNQWVAVAKENTKIIKTAWASCQIRKIASCACAGNAGNVFPRHRGLAIPTCITARAWRTCRDACRDC